MNGFLDIHNLILVSPLVACVLSIFLLTSKTNYLPRLPNVSFFTTIRIIKHFFAVIHWVIIFVFLVIGFLWTDLFFFAHIYTPTISHISYLPVFDDSSFLQWRKFIVDDKRRLQPYLFLILLHSWILILLSPQVCPMPSLLLCRDLLVWEIRHWSCCTNCELACLLSTAPPNSCSLHHPIC